LVRKATGNFSLALLTIAGFLVLASLIACFMRVKPDAGTVDPRSAGEPKTSA